MGILISNAAMTTTMATLRTTNLPATLPITFAAAASGQPGTTYVENGQQLVALLRKNGLPFGRELRVQWAPSPPAPTAVVNEVRNALSMAGLGGVASHAGQNPQAGLGAQAFSTGNNVVFGDNSAGQQLLPHEAMHVIQQRNGTGQ